MIRYYKKILNLKVSETWFNYEYKFSDIFSLNSFQHLKNWQHKTIPAVRVISHTVELNLEQDTELIFANFSTDIRRKIKKAEKEGIRCYFHNEIEKFVDFFNDFALKKHTYTTSKEKVLELGEHVQMSFAENDGKILAAHSYLVDKELGIVRGLNSGTKRLDEFADKSLIGRAHKYLVVSDILYFKEMGFKIFDFGGYSKDTKDESLKGINSFKLFFGGKVVPCINYYSYNYWALKKISKLLGLSGKL